MSSRKSKVIPLNKELSSEALLNPEILERWIAKASKEMLIKALHAAHESASDPKKSKFDNKKDVDATKENEEDLNDFDDEDDDDYFDEDDDDDDIEDDDDEFEDFDDDEEDEDFDEEEEEEEEEFDDELMQDLIDEFRSSLEEIDLDQIDADHNKTFVLSVAHLQFFANLVDMMISLEEDGDFQHFIEAMEERYDPGDDSDSPISSDHFNYWLTCDVKFGKYRSLAAYFLQDVLERHEEMREISLPLKIIANTRMGVYENMMTIGNITTYRELLTDAEYRCISPTGYQGNKGDLCLLRILSPLVEGDDYVIMSTPYLLQGHSSKEWIEFFESHGIKAKTPGYEEKLCNFMKYGPTERYWNDFILDAYDSHGKGHIVLDGLPDH